MAVYQNQNKDSAISEVEFSPVADGNFAFFYVRDPAKKNEVRAWLRSPAVGQEIVAEAIVNGTPVLVTHGDKTKEQIRDVLKTRGDELQLALPDKPVNFWAIRGSLGFVGQMLQLSSSMLRADRKIDWGLFVFASANLAANIMALTYGAQQTSDPHRLQFMKTHFNEMLEEEVPDPQALPKINEDRSALRDEPKAPLTPVQGIKKFVRENSVRIGEVGLRYLGAFALAFPVNRWHNAGAKLGEGSLMEAYRAGRNPATLTHFAGLGSLAGKTTAFVSATPDPYNPNPPSWLDTIREKYTFRAGGWMEAVAFGALAVDAFMHKKIKLNGKIHRDFLSGIGGALFTSGYVIRNWAPFGVRNMDMDEMYAHLTDALAKTPPEKLPQLMADSAETITENFKDKGLRFGQVYTQIMTDLYRYQHIALDNLGTEPDERCAKLLAQAKEAAPAASDLPQAGVQARHVLASRQQTAANVPRPPAGSHQEAVLNASPGVSAFDMGA